MKCNPIVEILSASGYAGKDFISLQQDTRNHRDKLTLVFLCFFFL